MKPVETKKHSEKIVKNRYNAIMWLCILYGGFAIIYFLLDLYSIIWRGSTFFGGEVRGGFEGGQIDANRIIDRNFATPPQFNPLRLIAAPGSIIILISGITSLLAGITIWRITREKEIKKIRQDAADQFLLPDEKLIIEALKRGGYALTQSALAKETGMNKVQVHRAIKRLEDKQIVEKRDFGVTNKILLKKELFE
jgi:uncharacterized membrane protein